MTFHVIVVSSSISGRFVGFNRFRCIVRLALPVGPFQFRRRCLFGVHGLAARPRCLAGRLVEMGLVLGLFQSIARDSPLRTPSLSPIGDRPILPTKQECRP